MRSRLLVAGLLVFSMTASSGCLKQGYRTFTKRAIKKNAKAYGPLEDHIPACDHEIMDIAYAPGEPGEEFLKLDVFYNDHDGLQPIIVQIHGGAWEVGDKSALNSIVRSRYLANQGYVVANVNYRMLPRFPVQVQINDVMGATVWIKENAGRYGGDPERVGVTGGSAGGHLTAMVAWASEDDYFVPTGHADSEYDSDVLAAVPYYGVFDLEETFSRFPGKKETGLKHAAFRYFTDTKKGPSQDELFRHISPKYHVDADIPPTFFICGDEDNFNLYGQSVEFERILREEGVATGLYTAEGAAHGFDIHYGEDYTRESLEATGAWFDRYLK